MTLKGLLFGIGIKDSVTKMKERKISVLDVVIFPEPTYSSIVDKYEVRLYETERISAKPSKYPDKIKEKEWVYSSWRNVDILEGIKEFIYPTAVGKAARVAKLLRADGIEVTINGQPIDDALEECQAYISCVGDCMAMGV